MRKMGMAITILALSGCASTGEWRALRIDGSSKPSFEESVASIQRELSPARRDIFDLALADIWFTRATADGEYVAADYFRLLDGLGYEAIVALANPEAIARQSRRASALWQQDLAARDRLDRKTARESCTAPIC